MKINIQKDGIQFNEVMEGELFVKDNSLFLKRYHHSVGEEFQAIRVGVAMGGFEWPLMKSSSLSLKSLLNYNQQQL